MTKVTKGDTVRLVVEFYDFDNNPIDPTNIYIIVENKQREQLLNIQLSAANRVLNPSGLPEVGKYCYDFTATQTGINYYYFQGTMNGTVGLRNGSFSVIDIDGTGGNRR